MADLTGASRPRGWGYELLVGGYLAPLALLPWASPTGTNWGPITTLVGGLAVATCIRLARPRVRRERAEETRPSAKLKSICLTGGLAESLPAGDDCYVALARFEDGTATVVGQSASPAPLLVATLHLARQHGDVQLVAGWGIEQHELDRLVEHRNVRGVLPASRHSGASRAGGREGATSMLVSSVALSLLVAGFAALAHTELRASSVALWTMAMLVLALLATLCLTARTTVSFGKTVRLERHLCGLLLRKLELPTTAISFLKLVGPDGAPGRHLLLAGKDLSVDWDCAPALGREVETTFLEHANYAPDK